MMKEEKLKNLTSRDRQAIATKNRIFETGISLIQEHGLDGVNVSQIVAASGVSVGTFYHYYKSKLDLFMDLYRSADEYFETEMAEKLEGLSFSQQLHLFFGDYADIAERNGIQLTQKMYIPENSLFISRQQGMHSVLENVVAKAQEDGICSKKNTPHEMESEMFLLARGVIFDWALHEGSYDLKSKLHRMLDIYIADIIC